MRRELQTVTIFARVCDLIRKIKTDNNLSTQLCPPQKFRMRSKDSIKKNIQLKKIEQIDEESDVEEIKDEFDKINRRRKYDQISTSNETIEFPLNKNESSKKRVSTVNRKRKRSRPKLIVNESESGSEYSVHPTNARSEDTRKSPIKIVIKSKVTARPTKRRKDRMDSEGRGLFARNHIRFKKSKAKSKAKGKSKSIIPNYERAQSYVL